MFGPIHIGTSMDGEEESVQNYLYHVWDPNGMFDKLVVTSGDSPKDGSPVDFGGISNVGSGSFPQIVMMGFGRAAFSGGPATPPHPKAYPCCFQPQIYDPVANKVAGTTLTSLQCVRAIGLASSPSGGAPPSKTLFRKIETFPFASVPHYGGYFWFTVGETITEGPRVTQNGSYLTSVNISGNTFQVSDFSYSPDVPFKVDYNNTGYSHSLSYSFVLKDTIMLGTGFQFTSVGRDSSNNMRAPIPMDIAQYGTSEILSQRELFSGSANSITFFINDAMAVSYPYGVVGIPGWVTDIWSDSDLSGMVNLLGARNHFFNNWGPATAWGFLYQDGVYKAMTFINSSYWALYKNTIKIQDYGYWVSSIFLNGTDWASYEVVSPLYGGSNCSGFFYPRIDTDDPGVFTKNGVTSVSGSSSSDSTYPTNNGFAELYNEIPFSQEVKDSFVQKGTYQVMPGSYSDYPQSWDFQVGLGTFGHSTSPVTYYPFYLLRGIARVAAVVDATPVNGSGVDKSGLTVLNTELHGKTISDGSVTKWWGTDENDIVARTVIGLCGPDYQSFYGIESTVLDSKFVYSDDRGVTWADSATTTPPYPPGGYAFRAGNSSSGFIAYDGSVWATKDRGRTIGMVLGTTDIGWINNLEVVGFSEVLPCGESEFLFPAPVTCPLTAEEDAAKKWVCKEDLSTEVYINTQYPVQSIDWIKFRTNYHKNEEVGEQIEAERWSTIDPTYYTVKYGESTRIVITTRDDEADVPEIVPPWCYDLKVKYTPVTSCTVLRRYNFTEGSVVDDLCVLPATANGFGMDIHPNQIGYMVDYDPEAANAVPEELVALTGYPEYTCFLGIPFSMSPYATGGADPFKWTAQGLPAGLSIADSGNITGTATTEGEYLVEATVVDSQSPKRTSTVDFTIHVRKQAL